MSANIYLSKKKVNGLKEDFLKFFFFCYKILKN